jgi:hypothetical protein
MMNILAFMGIPDLSFDCFPVAQGLNPRLLLIGFAGDLIASRRRARMPAMQV